MVAFVASLALLVLSAGCVPPVLYLPTEPSASWSWQEDGATARNAGLKAPEPPLRQLWQVQIGRPTVGAAVVAGPVILLSTTHPELFALERATGEQLGSYGYAGELGAPPVYHDHRVVIPTLNAAGRLTVLDRRSARQLWESKGRYSAVLVVSGDTLLAAGEDGTLRAMSLVNGQRYWRADVAGRIWEGIAADEYTVYAGNVHGDLWALDRHDGRSRWKADVGAAVRTRPLLQDSLVCVGTGEGRVVAVHRSTGALQWSTTLGALLTPELVAGGGLIVAGAADRRLYAIEPSDGRVRWRFETGGVIRGTPAATSSTAYVGSSDGHLYAVDLNSGNRMWSQRVDGPVLVPVTLAAGMLVAVSEKGTVYAFTSE